MKFSELKGRRSLARKFIRSAIFDQFVDKQVPIQKIHTKVKPAKEVFSRLDKYSKDYAFEKLERLSKRKKRAQLSSQMFVYILAIIIIGVTLLVGYTGIKTILSSMDQSALADFRSNFLSNVEEMSSQFQSQKRFELRLPSLLDEACFVSSMQGDSFRPETKSSISNAFIKDSVSDDARKNVFLMKEGLIESSFYTDKLRVDSEFLCLTERNSSYLLEAEGSYVLLR